MLCNIDGKNRVKRVIKNVFIYKLFCKSYKDFFKQLMEIFYSEKSVVLKLTALHSSSQPNELIFNFIDIKRPCMDFGRYCSGLNFTNK